MSLFLTGASQISLQMTPWQESQFRGRNNRAFLRLCRPEAALRNSVAALSVLLLSDFVISSALFNRNYSIYLAKGVCRIIDFSVSV